jgi:dipeptidyl aminopeptidase/acylaminoacyl peptidase
MCHRAFVSLATMVFILTFGVSLARPFTVADEIGLALFIPGLGDLGQPLGFSPNGEYVAVYSERGRLDLNRPEDSLRFYRSEDIRKFLKESDASRPPSPVWVVDRSTSKEGPIIVSNLTSYWRWLPDSSGVAFLERDTRGTFRFVLADVRKKTLRHLTPASQDVKAFDIRDENNYVYTVANPAERARSESDRRAAATVGTGRSIFELIFPEDWAALKGGTCLWAVLDGKRFEVRNNGAPINPDTYPGLTLSPNGSSLVTTLPVADVPSAWETLYPPPFASDPYRIRAGQGSASQYVRIDLRTTRIEPLTDAPIGGGWWAEGQASWSSDGQKVVLPGTFIASKDHRPSRPCVAVVDLSSRAATCVEELKGDTETGFEDGYHVVTGARFVGGDERRILVMFTRHKDHSDGTTEYRHTADGSWQIVGRGEGMSRDTHNGLRIAVKQGLNEPPLLIASEREISRVIWNPNPQLGDIEFGPVSVYRWKDAEGRDRIGGLYKPSNYQAGRRYPLVIQTHGFGEGKSLFLPSGTGFGTAFAARALAAVGIVVLQVDEQNCPEISPDEGLCAASGYMSAASQLASEGVVDPGKVGIIGFSRSCFYVMEALTRSSLRVAAASITDGVMETYVQYMLELEIGADEAAAIIGDRPFGQGLQQWLKRSPGFNLDRITAPLLVVGEGPRSLLYMWEPYAGLRYLHKPVELIMLNTGEHVLTNPAVRMASQGGSVDWFRFWLQGHEDSDPAKAEQYLRWEKLCDMQVAQNLNRPASCVRTKAH